MTAAFEAQVNKYLTDWLDRNLKHVLQPSYLGWVTSVGGGPRPAPMTVQVRQQGETATDTHDLVVLNAHETPQVGDLVDCYRRDGQTGYVLRVLTSARPIGPLVASRVVVGTDVAAPAASVTLLIPSGYSVAQIDWAIRSDNAVSNNDLYMRCNGDTGVNYDGERQVTAGAVTTAPADFPSASAMVLAYSPGSSLAPSGYFARGSVRLAGYAGGQDKEALSQSTLSLGSSAGQHYLITASGYWRSLAALNSVTFLTSSGNFVAGSLFVVTLY